MQRAKIRRYVLVGLEALSAVSMFPSLGGGSEKHSAVVRTERARYTATDCGTFDSTSIYPMASVFALRRVSCSRAIEVAKAYDGKGKVPGHWRCALAHGGGTVLFSCGKGGHRGNLRKWPHALVAKGEGSPS
jgi:hypothetical protein